MWEGSPWWKITETVRTEKALAVIVTEKETAITATSSRQTRPQQKWTLPYSSPFLCMSREKWGWRTGHVLQEAGERCIVLRGVSVKKARPMNDLLIGSLLHFLALCVIQTLLHFVVSRWCVDILITAENPVSQHCSVWRRSPSRSAVPFPLKSFNYFFCILAALSVERYIPLPE